MIGGKLKSNLTLKYFREPWSSNLPIDCNMSCVFSGPRGPDIGIGPGSGAVPAAMPVMAVNNPYGFQRLGMVPQANLSQQNMPPPMAAGQVAAGPGGLQGSGTSLMTLPAQNMPNPGQVPNLGPNQGNASPWQNL